jgi:hypothetical protein
MLPQRERLIFDESDIISQPWILLESPDPSFVRGALPRCGSEI